MSVADVKVAANKTIDMFKFGMILDEIPEAGRKTIIDNMQTISNTVKPTKEYYVIQILKVLKSIEAKYLASKTLGQSTEFSRMNTTDYKKEAYSDQYNILREELGLIEYTPMPLGIITVFPKRNALNMMKYANETITFWINHLTLMNNASITANIKISGNLEPLDGIISSVVFDAFTFDGYTAAANAAANATAPAPASVVATPPASVVATPPASVVAAATANDNTGGGAANVGVVATGANDNTGGGAATGLGGGSSSRKTRNRRRRRRRYTRRW